MRWSKHPFAYTVSPCLSPSQERFSREDVSYVLTDNSSKIKNLSSNSDGHGFLIETFWAVIAFGNTGKC